MLHPSDAGADRRCRRQAARRPADAACADRVAACADRHTHAGGACLRPHGRGAAAAPERRLRGCPRAVRRHRPGRPGQRRGCRRPAGGWARPIWKMASPPRPSWPWTWPGSNCRPGRCRPRSISGSARRWARSATRPARWRPIGVIWPATPPWPARSTCASAGCCGRQATRPAPSTRCNQAVATAADNFVLFAAARNWPGCTSSRATARPRWRSSTRSWPSASSPATGLRSSSGPATCWRLPARARPRWPAIASAIAEDEQQPRRAQRSQRAGQAGPTAGRPGLWPHPVGQRRTMPTASPPSIATSRPRPTTRPSRTCWWPRPISASASTPRPWPSGRRCWTPTPNTPTGLAC